MTPERLKECLAVVRWSPATLAEALRQDSARVEHWLDGSEPIPMSAASWMEALSFTHEASDLMRPSLEAGKHRSAARSVRPEHVPVYSYNLLRLLERGSVQLKTLFGTDDEGAVFFVVSRGLAQRQDGNLVITSEGRAVGRLFAR